MLYSPKIQYIPIIKKFHFKNVLYEPHRDNYILELTHPNLAKDFYLIEAFPNNQILIEKNANTEAAYQNKYKSDYLVIPRLISEFFNNEITVDDIINNNYFKKYGTYKFISKNIIVENKYFNKTQDLTEQYVNELGIYNAHFIKNYMKFNQIPDSDLINAQIYGKFIKLANNNLHFVFSPIPLLTGVDKVIAGNIIFYIYRGVTYKSYFILYTLLSNPSQIRLKYVNEYINADIDVDVSYLFQGQQIDSIVPNLIFTALNLLIVKNESGGGMTVFKAVDYEDAFFKDVLFGHIKPEDVYLANLEIIREAYTELLSEFTPNEVSFKSIIHSPSTFVQSYIPVVEITTELQKNIKLFTFKYLQTLGNEFDRVRYSNFLIQLTNSDTKNMLSYSTDILEVFPYLGIYGELNLHFIRNLTRTFGLKTKDKLYSTITSLLVNLQDFYYNPNLDRFFNTVLYETQKETQVYLKTNNYYSISVWKFHKLFSTYNSIIARKNLNVSLYINSINYNLNSYDPKETNIILNFGDFSQNL